MNKNNSGSMNSGSRNSGNWNSGYRNSGSMNSGYRNSGNLNSGYGNSGYRNSGSRNSGSMNSGNWNSGNWNSGNWNSGSMNSGSMNSGNLNSGSFNRDSPKMRLFEVELNMTVEEFHQKYDISMDIELNHWVTSTEMSQEQKAKNPSHETTGGYLKTVNFKTACREWWDNNPSQHERFLTLPNFNPTIFEEITGIKTEETCNETVSKLSELAKQLLAEHDTVDIVTALIIEHKNQTKGQIS